MNLTGNPLLGQRRPQAPALKWSRDRDGDLIATGKNHTFLVKKNVDGWTGHTVWWLTLDANTWEPRSEVFDLQRDAKERANELNDRDFRN